MTSSHPPFLMIPGPTPLPEAVKAALGQAPIGHRSADFKAILSRVLPRLQWAFQTTQPVLLYTASGTGAMEAALVNTLNPGDKVLSLTCGVFSQRFADIGKTLGLDVEVMSVPMGQHNPVEALQKRLAEDTSKTIKAVTFIHSETSTGVLNPVKELVSVIQDHGALSLVDTVTSIGSAEFKMDDWGVDIAVSGSQKGFMVPPGLSFLAMSEKALAAHSQVKNPGYYFNFAKNLKAQADCTTAWTPSTALIIALDVALEMMEKEGMPAIWARHRRLSQMTRAAMSALGLALFVEETAYTSLAVTSVKPPEGISVDAIRKTLRETHCILIADGQKELKGKIFRIGHLGYINEQDVINTVSALEKTLIALGYQGFDPGAGIGAAQASAKQAVAL